MAEINSFGPLGSTDKKCCVDINALFKELNSEDSKSRTLWTEQSILDWVETLNIERGLRRLNFALCRYHM